MLPSFTRVALAAFSLVQASGALAQALSVTLTPSNYNGYNVSCFGLQDGSIDATVTGGTAPYTYSWSNYQTTQDISGLPAGYYHLKVNDSNNSMVEVDITLNEPTNMKVDALVHEYPNGYNISLYNAYNGSIDVTVVGGVPPYVYAWNDGPTTQDRSGLGDGNYKLAVTDAIGCPAQGLNLYLSQPERSDWTMSGNTGSNPATNYIGTADATDMVFRSNGAERLRLRSAGDISLLGNAAIGKGFLYLDADGILKGGPYPYLTPLPEGMCNQIESFPFWETRGNLFENLCEGVIPKLGTRSAHPVSVITNNVQRMIITTDGKVGIGTTPPGFSTGYRLFVEGGIATRDVLVKLGNWPDYVFAESYHLLSLAELKDYLHVNGHLPGIPSAAEVDEKGGVELGDLQKRMLETIEQQALYILQLEERMKGMEQRLNTLETSK